MAPNGPPVVEVLRRREVDEVDLGEADDRQPLFEPLLDRIGWDRRCSRARTSGSLPSTDLHRRCRSGTCTAESPDSSAPGLCGCVRTYRSPNRGTGRASRRYSPPSPIGTQPRWVHSATMTSQLSCPSLTRSSSVCGILEVGRSARRARRRCPCWRAVTHEHRRAAPLDGYRLARLDLAQVEFDGGQRQNRRVRVHLVDERPRQPRHADRANRSRRDIEEVALARIGRVVVAPNSILSPRWNIPA